MMKLYRPWYAEYPERFEKERADMAARGFVLNDEALRLHRRAQFDGVSKCDPTRPLEVHYPGEFPSLPPRIISRTPGRQLRRHHHPTTWEICLFGPGQPRWSAREDGVKAVEEAETVIQQYSEGSASVLDDDVPEPASALFHYADNAAIVVPPQLTSSIDSPPRGVVHGTLRLRIMADGRGVVLSTRLGSETVRAGEPFNRWCTAQAQEETGTLVLLPEAPPFWDNSAAFDTWVLELKLKQAKWMAFVFPEQSGTVHQKRMAWVTVLRRRPGSIQVIRTFPYRPVERQARVPGREGLANKKVVLIGCGSMGSKIAVPLAATGVSRFGLVDGDIIKPENAVRHEVGVDGFGAPKVSAVVDRLVSMNPEVAMETDASRDLLFGMVGGEVPIEFDERLVSLIASADLVVETTGSHGVSRWTNEICHDLGIPAVYASVTNGAWGGEIVRVIPGHTACWQCWLEQYENEQPPSAPKPDLGVFAPGCDQPTFTGTSFEVGVVANLAAWIAAETLQRGENNHHDFAGDYMRWSARRGGIPDPSVQVLTVSKRHYCPVCNPT